MHSCSGADRQCRYGDHTYAELANLKNLYTGGISYDVVTYTQNAQPDSCQPKFKVKAKVLKEKLPQLFKLLQEILLTSRFVDKKRIRELLEQEQAAMELNLQRSAHQVVSSRLAAICPRPVVMRMRADCRSISSSRSSSRISMPVWSGCSRSLLSCCQGCSTAAI
jgi:hypothetical protein